MTQWSALVSFRWIALLLAFPIAALPADEFKVYTEQPRLFLRPQRLRLLKRERERQSMRWVQFGALVAGGAQMPEPAFAWGLYAAVTEDAKAAREAIQAALSTNDIRQVALVVDWHGAALSPEQAKLLTAKLTRALGETAQDVSSVRNRTLAALAIADSEPQLAERALREIVENWWRRRMVPQLMAGSNPITRDDIFALYELMHVIRDNLTIDLRENAVAWFRELPGSHLLGHYPAPYPAAENEYRIPVFTGTGEPDLRLAMLSRAAEFLMVAFDNNATESQFLQGWLMQDRFMMRGLLGAPYEFMLANPYQPGLSYTHFPLIHHNEKTGLLFVRESWEEDATWFGLVGTQMQIFRDGKITVLNPRLRQPPMELGATTILPARDPVRFTTGEATTFFLLGLKPRSAYDVEIDDQEMREHRTDPAGTLSLKFSAEVKAGVRLKAR